MSMHEETDLTPQEFTVSLLKANLLGTVFGLLPAALLFALFFLFWQGREMQPPPAGFGLSHFVALFVAGIVAHELLHALGWMLFAGVPRDRIEFGVKWKLLTPYTHTAARMPLRGYRIGTLLPGLLLGLLPALLALAGGSFLLLGFGLLFTVSAGGDFLILWLLRNVPARAQIADHPTRVGTVVYLDPNW